MRWLTKVWLRLRQPRNECMALGIDGEDWKSVSRSTDTDTDTGRDGMSFGCRLSVLVICWTALVRKKFEQIGTSLSTITLLRGFFIFVTYASIPVVEQNH